MFTSRIYTIAHLAVEIHNKYTNTAHLSCSPLKWYIPNYVIFMFTSRIYTIAHLAVEIHNKHTNTAHLSC